MSWNPPRGLLVALLLTWLAGCDEALEQDPDLDEGMPRRSGSLLSEPDVVASHNENKIETTLGGLAYITQCLGLGVPVPDTVLDPADPRWVNHGVLADPFLEPQWDAELWTYEDPDVGLCMALPRWNAQDKAELLGLICLGRYFSHTCFWDNPNGTKFSRGVAIDVDNFVGGFELDANKQGVCSDCHAGENPFVVHPQDPAFVSARAAVGSFDANDWPVPVVPEVPAPDEWPGNRGPLQTLGFVDPGQLRCDQCHVQNGFGGAGRFPLLSTELSGYCGTILGNAVAQTMPPPGFGAFGQYSNHVGWLSTACSAPPGEGQEVPFEAPPTVAVLPPHVVPPYACSRFVTVTGARLDAAATLLTLSVDGVEVASELMQDPSGRHVFTVDDPLQADQLVEATQTIGGVESAPGSATVRDHTLDYPDRLPKAEIGPRPIYECATAIAVHTIPGATVTINKKAGGLSTYVFETAFSHTWAGGLGAAFEVGDKFSVRQQLCTDVSRWDSATAKEAPDPPLPPVTFETPIESQKLINLHNIVQGSKVTLREQALGVVTAAPSVPYQYWIKINLLATPLGPVATTDQLSAKQQLCMMTSQENTNPPPALPCNQQPLPEIAQPLEDDDFVVMTRAVPGATIRVFDATSEIGNGTGWVIPLVRDLVGGELITVSQKLDACTVNQAFAITVHDEP